MKRKSVLGRACVGFVALFLCLTSVFAFAATEEADVRDAKADYPWLVQGLQKFNYPRYEHSLVATIHGGSRGIPSCKEIKNAEYKWLQTSSECRLIELNLVTVDGEYRDIKIILHESEEALFWHELRPHFVKYREWNPVIRFYVSEESENTGEFPILALRLVGRFKTDTMDTGTPKNWLKDYKEERHD